MGNDIRCNVARGRIVFVSTVGITVWRVSMVHVTDTLDRISTLNIRDLALMSLANTGAVKPQANARAGIVNRGTLSSTNHHSSNMINRVNNKAKCSRFSFLCQFFIANKAEKMVPTVVVVAKAAPKHASGL